MQRTILGYLLAFTVLGFLSACGAGITLSTNSGDTSNSGDSGNGGDSDIELVPLELVQVPDTRGDIQWNEPNGGAVSYQSDDGTGTFGDITPNCSGGICTYRVPNLDINSTYNVGIRYDNVDPAYLIINTDLTEVSATGHGAESKFGKYIDKGDINNDGYTDIIVSGIGARQADIFLGGPNHFPDDGFEPWATFAHGPADNYSVKALLADVDCDDIDDVIISDPNLDADALGRVYIYSGATFTPGEYTSASPADYVITETDVNSWFGSAMATADLAGTGCSSLIVGAPPMNGGVGEVFLIPSGIGGDLAFASGGAFSFMIGADAASNAGSFIFNVGDIDANGTEDVIFTTRYAFAPDDFTLSFVHLYPASFGVLDTTYWVDEHEFMAAPVDGTNDFYLSGGRTAGGGFINLYDDMTDVANEVLSLEHITDSRFAEGAAVCDLYPSIPGNELLIGTNDRIFVYYDYSLDPVMDGDPDDILSNISGGYQIICEDFNGDGYPDIISGDPRGGGNMGAVFVNY